jgi:hypothetical protein
MRITLAAALLAAALIPTPKASALENEELLAMVAMPLAVAAVSEVTDVPMNELIDVVTLMNDAAVPPAQFIEVVRYAPVALVTEPETQQPEFVEFVQLQFDNGLRGTALVNSIENQFQVYGVNGVDLDVTAPRIVDIDDRFIPAIVRTRIAERRAHPHGGPPGQLKKELGVQTGAEVVHGSKPNRRDDRRVATSVVTSDDRGRGKGRGRGSDDHVSQGGGKNRGHGGGGNSGKGGGKGKGKGKG